MDWIRNHPYADAVFAAGILLAAGAIVVTVRTSVAPGPAEGDLTWGGAGSVAANPVSRVPPSASVSPSLDASVQQGRTLGYIPLTPETGSSAQGKQVDSLASLLAQIARPMKTGSSQGGGSASPGAKPEGYDFVPSGLVVVSSPGAERSPMQEALYVYGNEAGGTIQAFEQANPNQPSVLKDFIENRQDAAAIAAMKKLGTDLAGVGDTLGNIDEGAIPAPARSAHAALIASYKDIGAKLAAIPDARGSDAALFDAIMTYDRAAESFVRKYVALVLVFQSYGVSFSASDGGSVFAFSNASL